MSRTWRPRCYRLLRHAFFLKKLATKKINTTMMNTSSLSTTPLWKQQRNNETSTILRLTALYSMLFRLICTAIATSLRSETYRALHHRVQFSHNIIVHRIASYTFPFVNASNRALLLYNQTIYGGSRFAASKWAIRNQVLSYNNERNKLLPPQTNYVHNHQGSAMLPCRANEL